jgi:hypothetical protein
MRSPSAFQGGRQLNAETIEHAAFLDRAVFGTKAVPSLLRVNDPYFFVAYHAFAGRHQEDHGAPDGVAAAGADAAG